MTDPLYTTDILRLAASLREPCALEREDGRAEMRSPTCGSRVVLAVQLDEERRVERLSMEVSACAFGQASAAILQRSVAGHTHEEVADALVTLSRWLSDSQDEGSGGWPGISVLAAARAYNGRHGAILLPFRTLLAAIEDAE